MRRIVIITSLKNINTTIHKCTSPKNTNEKNADKTKNLSAKGSKKTPSFVSSPYFRAIFPSKASVIDAIVKMIAEINFACSWVENSRKYKNTGVKITREKLNKFGICFRIRS